MIYVVEKRDWLIDCLLLFDVSHFKNIFMLFSFSSVDLFNSRTTEDGDSAAIFDGDSAAIFVWTIFIP